jgi:hypothetical protein
MKLWPHTAASEAREIRKVKEGSRLQLLWLKSDFSVLSSCGFKRGSRQVDPPAGVVCPSEQFLVDFACEDDVRSETVEDAEMAAIFGLDHGLVQSSISYKGKGATIPKFTSHEPVQTN